MKLSPLLLCVTLSVCLQGAPQLPVALNSAGTFSVLASSTVTNTGPSIITGDVGVSPGTAVVGFPPGVVVGGSIHTADGPAGSAQGDLTTAYNDAAGRTFPSSVAGDLGGLTLPPGLYKSTSSLGITGVLRLDGQGNTSSVFIFQIASALTTATGSQVILQNGAQAANIFWQVGSSATLGVNSIFAGSILAQASVSLLTGAAMSGRALARTGAVTLDSNTIGNPGPPVTGGPPPTLSVNCPASAAQVGVAYNSLVQATGGTPPYAFSITGSLPAGLSLNVSTGAITGVPTTGGSSSFAANVLDSASGAATKNCNITTTTGPAPTLTLACPASSAQTGVSYSSQLVATGGTRIYTYSITGSLPAGLSLTPSNGAVTGTPTSVGSNTFTATVTDSGSNTASQSCSIITGNIPPMTPAPSSLILVMIGFGCIALYRSRERVLQFVRRS